MPRLYENQTFSVCKFSKMDHSERIYVHFVIIFKSFNQVKNENINPIPEKAPLQTRFFRAINVTLSFIIIILFLLYAFQSKSSDFKEVPTHIKSMFIYFKQLQTAFHKYLLSFQSGCALKSILK